MAISYRLQDHEGRLVIEASDGRRIPWTAYGCSSERSMETWSRKQGTFIKAGAQVFQLAIWPNRTNYWLQPFWSHDGKPVEMPRHLNTLGEQMDWLVANHPDPYFLIRFGIWPDAEWRKANMDEFMPVPLVEGKSSTPDGLSINGSLASTAYLSCIGRLIRDIVAWAEKQPHRDRIAGYCVFPLGEGATEVGCEGGFFDRSIAMEKRFAAHVRAKYGTDAALRAAWGREDISLDTVRVPTDEEWIARRRKERLFHFPDPKQTQRERDYFECARLCFREYLTVIFDAMAEATADRPCVKGYDLLKQHMQGWMLHPRFDAAWEDDTWHTHSSIMFVSGAFGLADLLDHPGLDVLHTPGVYYNRAMGFAWESEGITDTLTLRKKLNYMEGDMRTWVNFNMDGTPTVAPVTDAGTFRNVAEARAGFDRAVAWALSRNQMFYYMNVFTGNWWYDDPSLVPVIADTHKLISRSMALPYEETRDAVCLVVDDESPLWEDFSVGYQNLAVTRQMEEGLALCGIPYRIHMAHDLARPDFPEYKTYIFPNLFKVDASMEKTLRDKVFRNGNVVVFGPGTAITDGVKYTPETASRLFGVEMELVMKSSIRRTITQDRGHPISARLPALTFGGDYAFGPLLVPKAIRLDPQETGATELGNTFWYYFFERPGLFIKEFGRGAGGNGKGGARGTGDYAVVYSAAVPLPPELIREFARYAGSTVWSERNAVVYGNECFAALHVMKKGMYTLSWPHRAKATDLKTGRVVADGGTSATLTMNAPDTVLLRLDPML